MNSIYIKNQIDDESWVFLSFSLEITLDIVKGIKLVFSVYYWFFVFLCGINYEENREGVEKSKQK